ncbi:GTP cyclohydrolase I FolE [Mucilaginibacter gossypii]|uniref:GTP cyclohydrolase 1 n=1 Tax=Mucilaginibacter gossypii TaxID=551996 RepID=A0A1G8MHE1_9SPHI|nr:MULTISPECIES: GTP cyclohydrolase I FolE [Mucilaginibacter]QTE35963.1 GTP cyclohydrolase I FolE [Mucilaginibacter gossypii]RAV56636.1 GTP cyclohydrolase I FolE [Mucilaginibacter rubeus]SDI67363.1 GTP cyclohydrolase I [Mucilaginibacter gossypii]
MSDSQFSQDTDDDDFGGYIKIDRYNQDRIDSLKDNYRDVLKQLGEDAAREGLLKTPERVAKAMLYLTHGYELNAEEILNSAKFKEDYSQMVVVKDIEVYSMCEHHMLPFFGKAHVAYIPNGHVVGLSKIPRVVDVFARRLQVQERLTNEIRDCIQQTLNPVGVGVVIECRHLCMSMRGVQKQNSVTTTSAFTGEFLKEKTRTEFLNLISSKLS